MARTKTIIRRTTSKKSLPKRSPRSSPLPVEVCERIIDFVALGWSSQRLRIRTLRACALTCRAWMPRSLYHIVSKFDEIQTAHDVSGYVAMLRKYPTFARYVWKLDISPDWMSGPPTWIDSLPLRLAPLLKNLKCITLTSRQSDGLHVFHQNFFQSLTLFKSVTDLYYHYGSKHSFKDFMRFVSSFPSLHNLWVGSNVLWADKIGSIRTPLRISARPRITHLVLACGIDATVIVGVTNWLLVTCTTSSLLSLEVWGGPATVNDKETCQAVQKFTSASTKLQTLVMCCSGATADTIALLDLRKNNLLRSLELIVDAHNEGILSCIIEILSGISSPHFRELTLRLNLLDEPDDALLKGFEVIGAILSASHFSNLKQLTVDVPMDIQAHLPLLHDRCVHICIVDSEDSAVLYKRRHPRS